MAHRLDFVLTSPRLLKYDNSFTQVSLINAVPNEILLRILGFVPGRAKDILPLLLVCRKWHNLTEPILFTRIDHIFAFGGSSYGDRVEFAVRVQQQQAALVQLRKRPLLWKSVQTLTLNINANIGVDDQRIVFEVFQNTAPYRVKLGQWDNTENVSTTALWSSAPLSNARHIELYGYCFFPVLKVMLTRTSGRRLQSLKLAIWPDPHEIDSISLIKGRLAIDHLEFHVSEPDTNDGVMILRRFDGLKSMTIGLMSHLSEVVLSIRYIQRQLDVHKNTLESIKVYIESGWSEDVVLDFSGFQQLRKLCMIPEFLFNEMPSRMWERLPHSLEHLDLEVFFTPKGEDFKFHQVEWLLEFVQHERASQLKSIQFWNDDDSYKKDDTIDIHARYKEHGLAISVPDRSANLDAAVKRFEDCGVYLIYFNSD